LTGDSTCERQRGAAVSSTWRISAQRTHQHPRWCAPTSDATLRCSRRVACAPRENRPQFVASPVFSWLAVLEHRRL